MSSPYYAASTFIIDTTFIKKMVPKQYREFTRLCPNISEQDTREGQITFEKFAREVTNEPDLTYVETATSKQITDAYTALRYGFEKVTNLTIHLLYISHYDDEEHEGVYWVVDNVMQPTDDAMPAMMYIQHMNYTLT